MLSLPTDQEQHWMLVSLAAIIRARGYEHFFAYPIVEPTRDFFPDIWIYSQRGLDRVVRRLMQFAALGDLEVDVSAFTEGDSLWTLIDETQQRSIAGLFLGIESGRCVFGFNIDAPADAEHMAGVMCHEVAHAYRAYHGLQVDVSEEEELLTDLTAGYLGIGILAANNSRRYRTSMELEGGLVYQHSSFSRTGYLNPQCLSYLLGLQMVVRNCDTGQRQRILRHLEPDQAKFTKDSFKECQARSEEFPEILGIPSEARAVRPIQLQDILLPLPEFEEVASVPTTEVPPGPNAGQSVFRVERTKAAIYGVMGALFVGVPGFVLGAILDRAGLLLVAPAIGIIGGVFLGMYRRFDVCSDLECGEILAAEADDCPGCGGTIRGRIASQRDHVDAVERREGKELWPEDAEPPY